MGSLTHARQSETWENFPTWIESPWVSPTRTQDCFPRRRSLFLGSRWWMCVGEQRVNYGLQFFGVCVFPGVWKFSPKSISSVCFLITAHSTYLHTQCTPPDWACHGIWCEIQGYSQISKCKHKGFKSLLCWVVRVETLGKFCRKMSVATDSILSLVSINLVVMATRLFQWQRCFISSAVRPLSLSLSLSIEAGYF